ncbi:MAG TPA: hypothetical protein VHS55_02485 [Solirubrobacteraceae bacterium]|nr:hypothetical protein [Solirubrobacteraceae bacterium]
MRANTASRSAIAGALATLVLAIAAPAAMGGVGQTIVDKCGKGEPFGGYTQAQYKEALKDMATGTSQYSSCESEIRQAELAAAGGGTGGKAGSASSHTAIPLSPAEQKAVQGAHKHGSAPVQVGGEPIRPGVVHANIASAVNTLPHSLFAVIALLLAAAVALVAGEVRKRVRARRSA